MTRQLMKWTACAAFVLTQVSKGEDAGTETAQLSPPEQASMAVLVGQKVHEFQGHADLAEYMRLRVKANGSALTSPAEDVAHYALKSMGQPYRKGAWVNSLGEADCVTFTERCIALGCTNDWLAARKLQYRLRYKDGKAKVANLNQEPILDWIPNNEWLFDEITESFGLALAQYQASADDRMRSVSYLPKESLQRISAQLLTGDILFVIADRPNPPVDPAMRTRCVHMAILYRETKTRVDSEDPQPAEPAAEVEILQSYPPAASRWPLERLFRNRYTRGAKILRLKPDARAIVSAELARFTDQFNATVNQIDNEARLEKGEPGYLSLQRKPDSIVSIDGVEYGVIVLKPRETLWRIFGSAYKGICRLPVNQSFLAKYPDLKAEDYQGDSIYYPIRPAGDPTLDPAPPSRGTGLPSSR